MPLFAVIGHDGPRGSELRPLNREGHLANLEKLDAVGALRHAGPLVGEDGAPTGSLILFEADDLTAARAFAASDPYVQQGVFERYEVLETRKVFPKD
jgi:hypothetical protein